jgi:hypothetical protein
MPTPPDAQSTVTIGNRVRISWDYIGAAPDTVTIDGVTIPGTQKYLDVTPTNRSTYTLTGVDGSTHTATAEVACRGLDSFSGDTNGGKANIDGVGTLALCRNPRGICAGSDGNLYITDETAVTIRKIDVATTTVTTLAGLDMQMGTVDGNNTVAKFMRPRGVAKDTLDNLFVADLDSLVIRKIDTFGITSTYAGTGILSYSNNSNPLLADLAYPSMMTIDSSNNLYVSTVGDGLTYGPAIRKITSAGSVSLFKGNVVHDNGTNVPTAEGTFVEVGGMVIDPTTGDLIVTDMYANDVKRITMAGVATRIAGLGDPAQAGAYTEGIGTAARFDGPRGVAVDATGNIYIADRYNHVVRKITGTTVSLYAGTPNTIGLINGDRLTAKFDNPFALAIIGNHLYVTETANADVRRIDLTTGLVEQYIGNSLELEYTTGDAKTSRYKFPVLLGIDGSDNLLVMEDTSYSLDYLNGQDYHPATMRKLDTTGTSSYFTGALDSTQGLIAGQGSLARFGGGGTRPNGGLYAKQYMVTMNSLEYMTDSSDAAIAIFSISSTGLVTKLGPYTAIAPVPEIRRYTGLAAYNNNLYASTDIGYIVKIVGTDLTMYAGNGLSLGIPIDGPNLSGADFGTIHDLVCDQSVGTFYIVDGLTIRKITSTTVSTIVLIGDALTTAISDIASMVIHPVTKMLYIAESTNQYIRRVDPATGVTTIVAGVTYAMRGYIDISQSTLRGAINSPSGLAFNSNNDLFVSTASGIVQLTSI